MFALIYDATPTARERSFPLRGEFNGLRMRESELKVGFLLLSLFLCLFNLADNGCRRRAAICRSRGCFELACSAEVMNRFYWGLVDNWHFQG